MRSDFKLVHLQEVNRKLDAHELSSSRYKEEDDTSGDESTKTSLWKKFLSLFKNRSSELPEDFYK